MNNKNARKKTAVLAVLAVVFIALMALSITKIAAGVREREEGAKTYQALAESVTVNHTAPPAEEADESLPVEEPESLPVIEVEAASLEVDFEALWAINPQVVAWISSDDGVIHYPVVQGSDNDYYLDHLIDGTVNANGSVFMDFRSSADLTDRNTFVYGHNMRNGAMFANLQRYSEPGYLQEHPELLLITPNRSYCLQVFAGCVVPGNSDLYQLSFDTEEDFFLYLERVRNLSEFSSPVQVSASDKIVTLSTCAYDYEDARYVLFCKLIAIQ